MILTSRPASPWGPVIPGMPMLPRGPRGPGAPAGPTLPGSPWRTHKKRINIYPVASLFWPVWTQSGGQCTYNRTGATRKTTVTSGARKTIESQRSQLTLRPSSSRCSLIFKKKNVYHEIKYILHNTLQLTWFDVFSLFLQVRQPLQVIPSRQTDQVVQSFHSLQGDQQSQHHHEHHVGHPFPEHQWDQQVQQYPNGWKENQIICETIKIYPEMKQKLAWSFRSGQLH